MITDEQKYAMVNQLRAHSLSVIRKNQKTFLPVFNTGKIFCCDKCRFKYRRIQSKGKPIISNYEVECLCCHKKFYSYRSLKRKFCSRECFDVFRKGGVDNESK